MKSDASPPYPEAKSPSRRAAGGRPQQDHVYFPTSGIVSLLKVMNDGAAAEIAVVGNEGMVGIALVRRESQRLLASHAAIAA